MVGRNEERLAVKLRKNPTPGEAKLWKRLRGRGLCGLKFRRQHPLGPYVVDFYCPKVRLIVEVDGESHSWRPAHEQVRNAFLLDRGYRVVRFANSEVLREEEAVLETIARACGVDPEGEPTL
jgi:very-short-patch-repair endonuclease